MEQPAEANQMLKHKIARISLSVLVASLMLTAVWISVGAASDPVAAQDPTPFPTLTATPKPVNPPLPIPAVLTDSAGNQYEVFTPEDGGTFQGEGFSFIDAGGAVPSATLIGVRMEQVGPAPTGYRSHHRYTISGNAYSILAVDANGAALSSYQLKIPAEACIPLPDDLRTVIDRVALIGVGLENLEQTVLSNSVTLSGQELVVCGNVGRLPITVAAGSRGASPPEPTRVPQPERLPATGAWAPISSWVFASVAIGAVAGWAGLTLLRLTSAAVRNRRRSR